MSGSWFVQCTDSDLHSLDVHVGNVCLVSMKPDLEIMVVRLRFNVWMWSE